MQLEQSQENIVPQSDVSFAAMFFPAIAELWKI